MWIAAISFASEVSAQTVSCPPAAQPTPEEMSKRIDCLMQAVEALTTSQSVVQRTVLDIYEQVRALGLEMKGPEKGLILVPDSAMAITHGYWAGGAGRNTFNCVEPATLIEGKTLFGAEIGPEIGITILNRGQYGPRGCAPAPHCDSAGEFCTVQARARGCYVNTLWYEWLQRQTASVVNYETVCQE
jgi:hypothetical protein